MHASFRNFPDIYKNIISLRECICREFSSVYLPGFEHVEKCPFIWNPTFNHITLFKEILKFLIFQKIKKELYCPKIYISEQLSSPLSPI